MRWIVSPRARGLNWVGPRFAVADCAARSRDRQLLLYCARGGSVDAARVRELAHRIMDWDALVEAAEFHGLAACSSTS